MDIRVLGFRLFKVKLYADAFAYRLESLSDRGEWSPGINSTGCTCASVRDQRYVAGPPPHQCGFWAYRDFETGWEQEAREASRSVTRGLGTYVFGLVLGSGRVALHRLGLRSQRSEIVGLGWHVSRGMRELARYYGVPLVPTEELPRVAQVWRDQPGVLWAHEIPDDYTVTPPAPASVPQRVSAGTASRVADVAHSHSLLSVSPMFPSLAASAQAFEIEMQKLRMQVERLDADRIWEVTANAPFSLEWKKPS